MAPYFESMAGARATAWGPSIQPPRTNAAFNLPGIEVYVDLAGLIDVAAEIAKKEKERDRVAGQIAAKEKKLANASFVDRARGSLYELDSWLDACHRLSLLSPERHANLSREVEELRAMLFVMVRSLRSKRSLESRG